jgi:hypothetical protein
MLPASRQAKAHTLAGTSQYSRRPSAAGVRRWDKALIQLDIMRAINLKDNFRAAVEAFLAPLERVTADAR